MKKYVFIDAGNVVKGVCTSERELTADEVYPNMNYTSVQVEDDDIINNFIKYEFDGTNFTIKEIIVPDLGPSDIELVAQGVSEREIQEIVQGQQISDLEIRLITGGL